MSYGNELVNVSFELINCLVREEEKLLNLLWKCGPIRAVLNFLPDVNMYNEVLINDG